MLTRVLPIGVGAAFVLFTAPGLVVRTIHPAGSSTVVASGAPAPTTPSAALTVAVTSSHPLLRVLAAGKPSGGTLLDNSGSHRAAVVATTSGCAQRTAHETGVGGAQWCLHVRGMPAGRVLSGTLAGGTALTLTLTRRLSFWGLPLLVLLVGLLTPFVTGWLMSRLTSFAGNAKFAELVAANAKYIDGLEAWAHDHENDADRLEVLQRILRGPVQVRRARSRLRDALTHTTLPGDHPFVAAAHAEAEKMTVAVDDIIDPTGAALVARAAAFRSQLPQLEADRSTLDELTQALAGLPEDHEFDARKAVDTAIEAFRRVEQPEDVASVTEPLVAAIVTVRAASETKGTAVIERLVPEAVAEAGPPVFAPQTIAADPLDLSGSDLKNATVIWRTVTFGAIVVTMAFAALTVTKAAYLDNPTFATFWDEFALFSAALASGAAATVLGLLHLWRPDATPA